MDPNATLKRITELLEDFEKQSPGNKRLIRQELREACYNLNNWLQNGGFQPRWLDYPEASEFFRNWQNVNA